MGCTAHRIEEGVGGVVQVKTQLSYDVFIVILTTCFGLDNGPSSGHKTYIWGCYTVWFIKWDMISYNSTRSRCHWIWTWTTRSRWIIAYHISFYKSHCIVPSNISLVTWRWPIVKAETCQCNNKNIIIYLYRCTVHFVETFN